MEEEEEEEEQQWRGGGRVIVHIDLDCFYAQVEMLRRPELREKPLGIQQKSLVVTCNYPARELGVRKLMLVKEAKEKCPELVLVNGEDLTPYREMSYKVTALNLQDPTHIRLILGSGIARECRAGLRQRLGLSGCAGIGATKTAAKLASGIHKPDQQTLLLPENQEEFLASLEKIQKIPGNDEIFPILEEFLMELFRKMTGGEKFRVNLLSVGLGEFREFGNSGKGSMEFYLKKEFQGESSGLKAPKIPKIPENSKKKEEKFQIPPGVDPEVWAEIPPEIREEIWEFGREKSGKNPQKIPKNSGFCGQTDLLKYWQKIPKNS